MTVAGVDLGSLSAKAVILEDNRIASWSTIPTGPDSPATAKRVMDRALEGIGLALEDLEYVVATGYGRVIVPFAHSHITEISCHSRGSHWFFPQVRTILDMGGQDCKAIRCDERGKVTHFVMNDKCAAGTGRYLERVAGAVELPLEEIGARSLEGGAEPAPINSFCAVFAESDILSLLRQGRAVKDVLAGACEAITKRVVSLLQKVGLEAAFSISGGVAKNTGVVQRLEEQLGVKALIAFDPQIVGALGAALFARDRLARQGAGAVSLRSQG